MRHLHTCRTLSIVVALVVLVAVAVADLVARLGS